MAAIGALVAGSLASSLFNGASSILTSKAQNRDSYFWSTQLMAERDKYRKAALKDSIDFWKMQNRYDSPQSQVARLRTAGLSPLSQFGVQGSQGLSSVQGVDGSQFAAAGARIPVADFADLYMRKESNDANIRLLDAEARLKNSQAADQEWKNTLQPQYEKQLDDLLSITSSQKTQEAIKAAWMPFQNAMQLALQSKDLQAKDKAIEKFSAEIDELVSRKELNEADAQKAKEGANLLAAQTLTENESRPWKVENLERDVQLKASQTALNWYERDVIKPAESRKIKADTAEAKKRAKQVDAEIERLGKLNNYTDEQIKYLKHLRAIGWAKFGVSTLKSFSEEARGWLGLLKNKSVSSAASSSFDDDALGAIAATL